MSEKPRNYPLLEELLRRTRPPCGTWLRSVLKSALVRDLSAQASWVNGLESRFWQYWEYQKLHRETAWAV
jgi:hypothetical protein